jgi:hypothetical protein
MSAKRTPPSVLGMIVAGVQVTLRHRRLAIALYLVQLFASLLFLVATEQVLASSFAHRPLFASGVDGNTEALILALAQKGTITSSLAIAGMAIAVAYFALSLFLTPGLIGVFAGLSFGDAATRWFLPYLRLWGWSLIPYVLSLVVAMVGISIGTSGEVFERMISVKLLVGRPLLFALPGLALLTLTTCAVDYARAQLVVGNRSGALRALLGGFRFVARNPASLIHYGLFLLCWAAVSLLYVMVTSCSPFAGAGGALLLFALRQVVAMARFGARVVTTGGQVALTMQSNGQ